MRLKTENTDKIKTNSNELSDFYGRFDELGRDLMKLSSTEHICTLYRKDEDKTDDWKNSVMVNNTNRDFVVNCKRAGIVSSDRLSVHCLRKSYGTNLADLGTPVHTLKSLMGHGNIQTSISFYIKNNDENSMKAVRGLEGLMGE